MRIDSSRCLSSAASYSLHTHTHPLAANSSNFLALNLAPCNFSTTQVINVDDVEGLLGKRAYSSPEMRNIDKFRHGATGKPVLPGEDAAASAAATEEGSGGDSEGGDKEEGGGAKRLIEPGMVVAT